MRTTILALALVLAALGTPARGAAQDTTTAIRPGMTEADVRGRWGDPVASRTSGQWKFLFYRNSMERSVGWYDTVFLQNGQVVDCVARGDGHVYIGQSSSPPDRVPARTLTRRVPNDSTSGAVTGVHINP
jgi:hypothetical protein